MRVCGRRHPFSVKQLRRPRIEMQQGCHYVGLVSFVEMQQACHYVSELCGRARPRLVYIGDYLRRREHQGRPMITVCMHCGMQ